MSNKPKQLTLDNTELVTLKTIQKLLAEAASKFNSMSNEAQNQILEFHNENSSLNHCLRWGEQACEELVEDCEREAEAPEFGYYIDLDERGAFDADVRDRQGKTIFKIAAGSSLAEGESSIFEDGYMRDKTDIQGLTDYLRDLDIIPKNGTILPMSEFERQDEPPRMRG